MTIMKFKAKPASLFVYYDLKEDNKFNTIWIVFESIGVFNKLQSKVFSLLIDIRKDVIT